MTSQPLDGQQVVITRMSQQGGRLRRILTDLGAVDVSVPLIAIDDPSDGGAALAAAIGALAAYDWVVVTSPNGADRFAAAVGDQVLPLGLSIAAIGPGTADRLAQSGFVVDFVPDRSVGEGLVEEFPPPAETRDRALVVQAEVARPVVVEGLRAKGWQVERAAAYRTVDAHVTAEQRAAIAQADIVTFTSSSTVDRFVDLVGLESLPPIVAVIGPITAATARDHGMTITIEAAEHTIDGLVAAVVDQAGRSEYDS